MAAGAPESQALTPETGVTMAHQQMVMDNNDDFTQLDDSALLSRRAEMRDELERLPASSFEYAVLTMRYDQSTIEVTERARKAWSKGES
jgi:hypothetical protein